MTKLPEVKDMNAGTLNFSCKGFDELVKSAAGNRQERSGSGNRLLSEIDCFGRRFDAAVKPTTNMFEVKEAAPMMVSLGPSLQNSNYEDKSFNGLMMEAQAQINRSSQQILGIQKKSSEKGYERYAADTDREMQRKDEMIRQLQEHIR